MGLLSGPNRTFRRLIGVVLQRTPAGLLPVRVRRGIAAGARWTLYPWTSYWRGTHEPEVQAALLSLGEGSIAGWTCWDLGAHFGLYSVGLARRVGPSGQVAAFEPNPLSYARLERHRQMNELAWLRTYPAAVSDHNVGAELFTYGDLGTTTTHLPYDGETRNENCRPMAVRTVRLDDLVASGELRSPHFVKVDVEGHGHHAVAGMSKTLAAARPILMIAFHSPQEIDGIMEIIAPLQYAWSEIPPSIENPHIQVGRDYLFRPTSGARG